MASTDTSGGDHRSPRSHLLLDIRTTPVAMLRAAGSGTLLQGGFMDRIVGIVHGPEGKGIQLASISLCLLVGQYQTGGLARLPEGQHRIPRLGHLRHCTAVGRAHVTALV